MSPERPSGRVGSGVGSGDAGAGIGLVELARLLANSSARCPVATYNLSDAKNQLSDLVERAVNGEEVVIARRNLPAVRLVPVTQNPRAEFGRHRHLGRVTDAFFEPLPEEEMEGLG